ncbi:MAG: hypothetical protein KatS3mg020_0001 [Fimbriimonadales bacterium]|nr:MAG: hypothetical protein KatS3mg020_0001 [Fimbriimonadales bacterium]
MFTNAQDALEWLRARGYPALPQPLHLKFPFGGKRAQAAEEFALLVKAEREGDLLLHIYWMRVATGFDNVATLVGEFAKKYPQILPLFFVRRERSLRIWTAYPDSTARMRYRKKSLLLDPNAKELLAALCYDPNMPHEKHWHRILRAITGEDAMHPRIEQAFESFLAELHEIQADIQNAIRAKTDEVDFESIPELVEQAKQIKQLIGSVEDLRRRWTSSAARTPSSKSQRQKRKRASDEITPQSAYIRPLLEALVALGGRATVSEVTDKVYEMVKEQLKPRDREWVSSNEERWRNAVKWMRNRLKEQGYLRSDSPKGIWEITDAGRAYLKQLEHPDSTE